MSSATYTSTLLLGTDNNDGTFTGVTSGASVPIRWAGHSALKFTLIGNGTISGGTVLIETAYMTPNQTAHYDGTWGPLVTMNASDVTGTGQKPYYVPGPIPTGTAMRARISSNITGGGGVSVAAEAE